MSDGAERQGGIIGWNRRLYHELVLLPDTLAQFRTGVQDLSRVAMRLEMATEIIERAQGHLDRLGVTETARQFDDAAAALQAQLGSLVRSQSSSEDTPAPGVKDAVEQMQRTVAGLAELGGRLLGAALRGSPPSDTP